MISYLKEIIKIKYKELLSMKISLFNRESLVFTKNKQAFIMLAANYNNLGDIAIVKAQEDFLKRILPSDYEVIVVPHNKTFNTYLSIKKRINKYTIITLVGGGNQGTLYEFIEWPRRFILKHYRKCKIISFSQSVYYENKGSKLIYKKSLLSYAKNVRT